MNSDNTKDTDKSLVFLFRLARSISRGDEDPLFPTVGQRSDFSSHFLFPHLIGCICKSIRFTHLVLGGSKGGKDWGEKIILD